MGYTTTFHACACFSFSFYHYLPTKCTYSKLLVQQTSPLNSDEKHQKKKKKEYLWIQSKLSSNTYIIGFVLVKLYFVKREKMIGRETVQMLPQPNSSSEMKITVHGVGSGGVSKMWRCMHTLYLNILIYSSWHP